eukprot:TRINITY_DN48578_c0_g1_i1.p1 TRINITY_DN48578_c0_g1~~TRINITY_DN48578_c0_g1_i1.p1  ORF type:complete len:586 (-),score=119.06 TRINITY_DN48578_c0_g1_i1:28-1785(-)
MLVGCSGLLALAIFAACSHASNGRAAWTQASDAVNYVQRVPEGTLPGLSPWYCPPVRDHERACVRKYRHGQAPMYLEGTLAPMAVRVLLALAQEPSVSENWTQLTQAVLAQIEALRLISCTARFTMCYTEQEQMLSELCSYLYSLSSSLAGLDLEFENICEVLFFGGDGSAVLRGISKPLHQLVSKAFPSAAPAEVGNFGTRFNFEEFFEKRAKVWQQREADGIKAKDSTLLYPPIFSPGGVCSMDRLENSQSIGPDVMEALKLLEQAQVTLSHFVVNFGAADGECGAEDDWNADPANCLTAAGYSAVVIEGDNKFFAKLRDRFGNRDNVSMMLQFMPLNNVTNLLRERLRVMTTASSSPDLLKVDVDHADCLFMQEALRVIHPKLIHVEYMPQAPPPLDYAQHYQSELLDVNLEQRSVPLLLREQKKRPQADFLWSEEQLRQRDPHLGSPNGYGQGGSDSSAGSNKGREMTGCSLTAFLSRAPGYALLAAGDEEALLVRMDLQPLLGLGPAPHALDAWILGSLCNPARLAAGTGPGPDYAAWGFDFRSLADQRVPAEERRRLLESLLKEHGATDFSLKVSWTEA